MMRKFLFFSMILLFVFSLMGCTENEVIQPKSKENNKIEIVRLDGKTVISLAVARVGESLLDVKYPHIIYNQENSIELQAFVDAIEKAEKVDGVFDMTAPNYQLTLTFEDKSTAKYSLWLGVDGGSLMDEKESHTLYRLPSNTIEDLNKYVK
ncbi:MAG: hypothetical protein WB217_14200 [Mesobacillus sp.]|uniref:hypothetical protein n=1 Tax=Mesobacillus sp. TaxID=2675271 RepID=UPI003C469E19